MLLTEIENHNLREMADVLANAPKLPARSIKIIRLFQVTAPLYLTKITNFRKSFVICFRQGIKTPTKGLDRLVLGDEGEKTRTEIRKRGATYQNRDSSKVMSKRCGKNALKILMLFFIP